MASQVSHHRRVSRRSQSNLSSHEGLDARMSRIIHRTDFSYFCAVVLPDANAEALRTSCDWGNWVSLVATVNIDKAPS